MGRELIRDKFLDDLIECLMSEDNKIIIVKDEMSIQTFIEECLRSNEIEKTQKELFLYLINRYKEDTEFKPAIRFSYLGTGYKGREGYEKLEVYRDGSSLCYYDDSIPIYVDLDGEVYKDFDEWDDDDLLCKFGLDDPPECDNLEHCGFDCPGYVNGYHEVEDVTVFRLIK